MKRKKGFRVNSAVPGGPEKEAWRCRLGYDEPLHRVLRRSLAAFNKETSVRLRTEKPALKRVRGE